MYYSKEMFYQLFLHIKKHSKLTRKLLKLVAGIRYVGLVASTAMLIKFLMLVIKQLN